MTSNTPEKEMAQNANFTRDLFSFTKSLDILNIRSVKGYILSTLSSISDEPTLTNPPFA